MRGEHVTLPGSYYQVHDALLRPPPDRPIPILVAAQGRRMLRLTACYADAWYTAWFGPPDDLLRRRLAELKAALEAEGRDPATLRRTVGMEVRDPAATDPGEDPGEGFDGSVDELARAIDAQYRTAGSSAVTEDNLALDVRGSLGETSGPHGAQPGIADKTPMAGGRHEG
jgi:alkanesulfonate monooxygenase SsuD/methylene tetrahydromethanopterin reductase-like flavin-dependent oxidoreductase (luciferase family)